ncbi:tRNA(His) guanylyltransferase Thg1 family protein [Methanosalsum natronophilum]|uniref:tRNA(His) guanylyltransferase Thg1 family protein n=1 Tax=Methanosalsum natronophilum TaxID=768733 RepID=UPI002168B6FD|nr:tRNA(His) guanylyltransferase Thg1 family protein [Methanosalsum natronophilum]MCS3923543.1 tRNA(His) 5'-end guanylyltransferase [Methanosalsum natronophilum]
MKENEIYADIRSLPPVIIRIDGRNFKKTLEKLDFEKPYDFRLTKGFADSIESFFKKSGLNPILSYTFSDEVSFLFLNLEFDGRIEKLDSIVPSYFSSSLSIELGLSEPISFDSRVIPVEKDKIVDYFIWRQREAWRNYINSYGHYTLIKKGMSPKDAFNLLKNKDSSYIHELMFEDGINLAKLPSWQRKGIVVYKHRYLVEGYNPKDNIKSITQRQKIVQKWDIPEFSSPQGHDFLVCNIFQTSDNK